MLRPLETFEENYGQVYTDLIRFARVYLGSDDSTETALRLSHLCHAWREAGVKFQHCYLRISETENERLKKIIEAQIFAYSRREKENLAVMRELHEEKARRLGAIIARWWRIAKSRLT